jgi:nicotinate phosphoribosyltransferase
MTNPQVAAASTALLTDRYELTMLQAALADGTAGRRTVFEVFTRRLPAGRRYAVLAGTGRVLDAIEAFRFDDDTLAWLEQQAVVDRTTLDYLAGYRFTGDVVGYAEGEVFFPGSPLLHVEGTFAEAVLLETVVLSVLNYDSAIASAASRMTAAAGGRPCLEMGARRTNEDAAVAAARAAVIGGFAGTSDLGAGRRYGLTTIGTAAHAFTLLHDDEQTAFATQVAAQGVGTTLLVDTYDVRAGVQRALAAAGTSLGAVRLDSGDLGALAHEVRAQLDAAGATQTAIVVTSDLDEYAIAALAAAPVDSYGVGTSLVTGSGAPTCSMVYKLVAREGADGRLEPVAKASAAKTSVGGRKGAARGLGSTGRAVEEVVITGPDAEVLAWQQAAWRSAPDRMRPLQVPLVQHGEIDRAWTGAAGVRAAAARHTASRAELPRGALRLSADEPELDTVTLRL